MMEPWRVLGGARTDTGVRMADKAKTYVVVQVPSVFAFPVPEGWAGMDEATRQQVIAEMAADNPQLMLRDEDMLVNYDYEEESWRPGYE